MITVSLTIFVRILSFVIEIGLTISDDIYTVVIHPLTYLFQSIVPILSFYLYFQKDLSQLKLILEGDQTETSSSNSSFCKASILEERLLYLMLKFPTEKDQNLLENANNQIPN